VAGTAANTPDTPFAALPGAHAIIASAQYLYDGAVMDRNPELRVISRTGIGVDMIVIPDATERGIVVCNAPDGPTISTAEHTFTLLLVVAKDLKRVETQLQGGEKINFFGTYSGIELNGLQLGLVGLGRIGSRVARMAQALEMHVVAYDPYVPATRATGLGVELVSTLEDVLRTSDIVSLHLPLTDETRHLMNASRLAMMKPGAILINAARGGLVDEAALVEALDRGHLRGAGLDVLSVEPIHLDPGHPLLHRDNVIVTPHIAGLTGASKNRLWQMAITQALQVLQGERPPNVVNPEVWLKRKPILERWA
jgi:D-3-phosphoglycerate dehydrogenase